MFVENLQPRPPRGTRSHGIDGRGADVSAPVSSWAQRSRKTRRWTCFFIVLERKSCSIINRGHRGRSGRLSASPSGAPGGPRRSPGRDHLSRGGRECFPSSNTRLIRPFPRACWEPTGAVSWKATGAPRDRRRFCYLTRFRNSNEERSGRTRRFKMKAVYQTPRPG